MSENEIISQCPFCWNTPTFTSTTDLVDNFDHGFSLSCGVCGIEMSDEYRSDVVARWNTRGDPLTVYDADTLAAKDAEIARLREALQTIRDLQPSVFNAYPSDWNEQIAACDKCQSYKNHPVMRGICDTHRQPTYDRERHDAHEVRALGYRAKSMARDAVGPAFPTPQTDGGDNG